MKILLTGATSFLGRKVSRMLIARGHEIYAPVRPSSSNQKGLPEHPLFRTFPGDINDAEGFLKYVPGIDACIHFAWEGVGAAGRMDPLVQERNLKNTLSVIRLAGRLGAKVFLFAGSQAEYGVTAEKIADGRMKAGAVSEAADCDPVSEYGKTKLKVLQEGCGPAEALGMAYRHMRIFSVYGEGDHGTSLVSVCTDHAKAGTEAVLGPCAQIWNFLYADDCAEAVVRLTELPAEAKAEASRRSFADLPAEKTEADVRAEKEAYLKAHVYNIGSDDTRRLKSFAEEIFHTAGSGSVVFLSRPAGPEGTPVLDPDINKIKAETGWKPVTAFSEGIRRMLAAEKEEL